MIKKEHYRFIFPMTVSNGHRDIPSKIAIFLTNLDNINLALKF